MADVTPQAGLFEQQLMKQRIEGTGIKVAGGSTPSATFVTRDAMLRIAKVSTAGMKTLADVLSKRRAAVAEEEFKIQQTISKAIRKAKTVFKTYAISEIRSEIRSDEIHAPAAPPKLAKMRSYSEALIKAGVEVGYVLPGDEVSARYFLLLYRGARVAENAVRSGLDPQIWSDVLVQKLKQAFESSKHESRFMQKELP